MLTDCDVDAISVALPDHLHVDATIAATSAGKHVEADIHQITVANLARAFAFL